jgi:ABC-2 type transport system permease protein
MVGWLPFLGLFAVYYVMSYLIFGSIYLTTGGMSPTPREAQIYTLPISIIQLLSFMGGAYAASAGGMATWIGIAFPFTSPYVLLGYAAEKGGSLVHVVGIIWQLAVVTFAIRFGAQIFRSRVIDQRPVFRRKRRDARAT